METLILHPTVTCQWHALLNDAQVKTRLVLNEQTESYLVFLLIRYTQNLTWLDSVLALDFLHSEHRSGSARRLLLQELGDKSLLFSGLFPKFAERRQLNLQYFKDMGQSAYGLLSARTTGGEANLYEALSLEFGRLIRVLHAVRVQALPDNLQNCWVQTDHGACQ